MSEQVTPTVTPVAIGVHMAIARMRHEARIARVIDSLTDTSPPAPAQSPTRAVAVAAGRRRGET